MIDYTEIDRNIVINKVGDLFELRIWNESGSECPRRGLYASEGVALSAGRERLSYIPIMNREC